MIIVTVIEGRVKQENWGALKEAFHTAGGGKLPPQMIRTYLTQNQLDPELWRLETLWRSREALEEIRARQQTPAGILLFRKAGAETTHSVWEIDSIYEAE